MNAFLSGKISEEKNGNMSPIYTVLNYVNCSLNYKTYLVLKMHTGIIGGKGSMV